MRLLSKKTACLAAAALIAGLLGAVPATADHNADDHSKNVKQLTREPIRVGKKLFAQGSDLAFKGKLAIAGTYQGTALFKILPRAPFIDQIGFHACPGSQGDVSVSGNLAFVSIDSAG